VEGNGQAGTLYVNRSKASLYVSPSGSASPNLPTTGRTVGGLGGGNAMSLSRGSSSVGLSLNYNTAGFGWGGASFSYDAGINLSSYSSFSFGMIGSPSRVKFEVEDYLGRKFSMYLTGVRSDLEQTWTIQKSLIEGIDLTNIKKMNFIVEGDSLTGNLDVIANQ
jgi:hypothetical protein